MRLTFEQFAARVYSVAKDNITNKVSSKKKDWYHPQFQRVSSVGEINSSSRLEGERIHVGGTSGGSCWDEGESTHHGYTTSHGEIEIECLEELLADIDPNITFLQYKRLTREMDVKLLETSENEYYGNCSDYQQKVVLLGDLYNALLKVGVIE